jgi:hypothetical protein
MCAGAAESIMLPPRGHNTLRLSTSATRCSWVLHPKGGKASHTQMLLYLRPRLKTRCSPIARQPAISKRKEPYSPILPIHTRAHICAFPQLRRRPNRVLAGRKMLSTSQRRLARGCTYSYHPPCDNFALVGLWVRHRRRPHRTHERFGGYVQRSRSERCMITLVSAPPRPLPSH